jgi:hypothetical protein
MTSPIKEVGELSLSRNGGETGAATPKSAAPTRAEFLARRVAVIVGPNSAAAAALTELSRRKERGENVELTKTDGVWVVGPKAASEPQPRAPQTEREGSRDESKTDHPTSTTRGETP